MKKLNLLLSFLIGITIWFLPTPEGLDVRAWHLFAIFVSTIYAVITKPYPMGVLTFTALAVATFTKTLSYEEAFSGFSNAIVWLIVFAFFVARGFIETGLGHRISLFFMRLLGKSTLGLGYGMAVTDLILAPAIPSITARAGGVIFPLVDAVSKSFGSEPHNKSKDKIGSYLIKVTMQSTAITSGMFLTSMAANPLIATLANENSGGAINITWGSWALAACVPGLVSLIVVPYVIYKLFPPEIKQSPQASLTARKELKKMGKVTRNEWIMIATFIFLIVFWALANQVGINPPITAVTGLSVLLLTGVLNWGHIRKESGAWETMVWFGVLLMIASQLSKLGMTAWFGNWVSTHVAGFQWQWGFLLLSLLYFYAHYFFASNLAHVCALYATFLVVSIELGTPPTLAALVLGFFSNLIGGLTHYSSGPAAILFESGYNDIKVWWKTGAIISAVNILIWMSVGTIWWKALGLW